MFSPESILYASTNPLLDETGIPRKASVLSDDSVLSNDPYGTSTNQKLIISVIHIST